MFASAVFVRPFSDIQSPQFQFRQNRIERRTAIRNWHSVFRVYIFLGVVLGISAIEVAPLFASQVIYVKCHYKFDSAPNDFARLPCFLIDAALKNDTTGIVRAYSFIQPYGTDSAVGWVESDSPWLIPFASSAGTDTFVSVREAIEYARKILKYKGRINWK